MVHFRHGFVQVLEIPHRGAQHDLRAVRQMLPGPFDQYLWLAGGWRMGRPSAPTGDRALRDVCGTADDAPCKELDDPPPRCRGHRTSGVRSQADGFQRPAPSAPSDAFFPQNQRRASFFGTAGPLGPSNRQDCTRPGRPVSLVAFSKGGRTVVRPRWASLILGKKKTMDRQPGPAPKGKHLCCKKRPGHDSFRRAACAPSCEFLS